jgi:hypothetical protein
MTLRTSWKNSINEVRDKLHTLLFGDSTELGTVLPQEELLLVCIYNKKWEGQKPSQLNGIPIKYIYSYPRIFTL